MHKCYSDLRLWKLFLQNDRKSFIGRCVYLLVPTLLSLLDPSNPICHSWQIATTIDWSPFFEHRFSQHLFVDVSRIYGRNYGIRGPQRSIFSSWKSWLSLQLKWVIHILYLFIFCNFLCLSFFRSIENLAKEINENCQSIPRNSLTVELDGKRRVSTCSGYSTTTGNTLATLKQMNIAMAYDFSSFSLDVLDS